MTISERIAELLDSIRSRDDITFVKEKVQEPVDERIYTITEEELGLNFKNSLHPVFSQHKRIEIVLEADELIISECQIPGLIYIFNDVAQEDCIYTDDNFAPEFNTFAKKLYPLDEMKQSLDSITCTAVHPVNEDTLEFYIWNNSGQKYKLRIQTFEEYMHCAIDHKFIVGWQYFYVDTDAMDFSDPFTNEWLAHDLGDAVSRMEDVLETAHKYFSDDNWEQQEQELARIKAKNSEILR